jgi:CubicO group peptidase (beta-lactamase class C family)
MIRGFAFVLVVCLLCSTSLTSASSHSAPNAEAAIRAIETQLASPVEITNRPLPHRSLRDEMKKNGVPAVSIAVIHEGKIQWAEAYGSKGGDGSPVTTDTLFQAASISKSVTAMTALALVEKGKLSLDAPINTQLKSWMLPDNQFTSRQPVTLRELLSNTGGTSVIGFGSIPRGAPLPTLKQILNGTPPANSPPVAVIAEPGTAFNYSGGGFEIVEQVIEDATGEPFAEVARKTILARAGMSHSNFRQPIEASLLNKVAFPQDAYGTWIAGGPPSMPALGAGGMWTTASDLARLVIDLQKALAGNTGGAISPASAHLMMTPVKADYGLGVEVKTVDGRMSFEHTGSNSGYQSMFVGYADGDGAVVMTSSDNGFAVIAQIVPTLARVYGWEAYQPEKRVQADVPLARQMPYTGEFATKDGYTFKVTSSEGHLEFAGLGHSGSTLLPSSEKSFFVTDNTMRLTFDTTSEGIMDIGGQKKPFVRTGPGTSR